MVKETEEEAAVDRFGPYPREDYPLTDVLAAQNLMLEANEAEFRRIAN